MTQNIWFTSDLHLGHTNILRLCERPFETIQEHDETLVANFNTLVKPGDITYFMGDIFYRCGEEYAQKLFDSLHGQKFLIIGNHDNVTMQLRGWTWQKDMEVRKINNRKMHLCHYPLVEWQGFYSNALMLHGHQHNRDLQKYKDKRHDPRILDVGVDMHGYAPVNLDQILVLTE